MEEKAREERNTAEHRHSSSKGAVVFEKHPSFPTGLSRSRSGSHSHSHGTHTDAANEHSSHQHASHTNEHSSHQHASHTDTTDQHSSHHHVSVGHAHADGSIHYGSHVGDESTLPVGDESTLHHHSAETQKSRKETVNHHDQHQLNHRGSEDTLAAAALSMPIQAIQASTKKHAAV